MPRPSHRPYFYWPTLALRAVVAMHGIMPWRALGAHLELLYRADATISSPIAVTLRASTRGLGV